MNKNLQMIENKNNFFTRLFYKIRNFFKNSKSINEDIEENNDVKINENVTEDIKLSDEYKELLKLQKEIENEEISIADISDEQAEKLIELYEKQNV